MQRHTAGVADTGQADVATRTCDASVITAECKAGGIVAMAIHGDAATRTVDHAIEVDAIACAAFAMHQDVTTAAGQVAVERIHAGVATVSEQRNAATRTVDAVVEHMDAVVPAAD